MLDRTSLSVVVPCYNAQATVAGTLESLVSGVVAPDQIICVDDASDDATSDVVNAFSRTSAVPLTVESLGENLGAAAARNRGAAVAVGDLLLFVDADVLVSPEAVGVLKERMVLGDVAAVVALYSPSSSATGILDGFQSLLAHLTFRELDPENLAYFGTQCVVLRRKDFVRLGGFQESFRGATVEDLEFGIRLRAAGGRIALAEAAVIFHNRTYTVRTFTRNYFDKAKGLAILVRRCGSRAAGLGEGYSSWRNLVSLGCVAGEVCAAGLAFVPGLRPLAAGTVMSCTTILAFNWRAFAGAALRLYGPSRTLAYLGLRAYITLVGAAGALAGVASGGVSSDAQAS